jgi:predicted DNA-binding protein (MmcQ/YjbR family)
MNIESVREYCLSLPLVTEDFPFDEQTLVFRILGKIFACVDLERPEWVTMKCNADYALELREEHPEIEGAWHWNKKYWNQVNLYGTLEDDPGQDALGSHPHQACHHLPGAQALFLSRFYQYECKERRQGRLRIQGNSEQIKLWISIPYYRKN